MRDYSNMSDFEINGRVAKATQKIGDSTQARGKTFIHDHKDVGEFKNICIGWKEYDPCNNPADAWPIIKNNKISLTPPRVDDRWDCCTYDKFGCVNHEHYDANPLRAAMIVFLMTKERA